MRISGGDLDWLGTRRQIGWNLDADEVQSWRSQTGKEDKGRLPANRCRDCCGDGVSSGEDLIGDKLRWIRCGAKADHVQI